MKKAVIWGAGREGRGFFADLFCDAGWDVVFAENKEKLCVQLLERKQYTLWQCSAHGGITPKTVSGFSVINPSREEKPGRAAAEIAEAKILALCVYPHQYEQVIRVLDKVIGHRTGQPKRQLCDKTLLLGVNETDAGRHILDIAEKTMRPENYRWFCGHVGIAPCIVRRTCTAPSEEYLGQDPLGIMTNSYPELLVDGTNILGDPGSIRGIRYITDLERELTIKLYTYNLLHAVYAYAGAAKGYRTLWEAYTDPEIHARAKTAIAQSCRAVSLEYGISEGEMAKYQEMMWSYAVCRELGDTIERLAADTLRKLSRRDRIMGPILLCKKHGLNPQPIYETLVDAVCYLDSQRCGEKEGI